MNTVTSIDRRSVLAAGLAIGSAPAAARAAVQRNPGLSPADEAHVDAHFRSLPPLAGTISNVTDAYNRTALALSRDVARATRCILDVPYGNGPAQRLDIYLPDDVSAASRRPVFVQIHGGAWRWGYKEWMGLNAPPLLASGAIFISIGYSLAPESRFPAALDDCSLALAWIRANVASLGGDPEKILMGGHSAGGHLSALLVLRPERLASFGLPAGTIKGAYLASGSYDFRDPQSYGLPITNTFVNDFIASPADLTEISPIAWAKKVAAPIFLCWGSADRDDARLTGPAFVEALRSHGNSVQAHIFSGLDHLWMHVAQQNPANAWTRAATDHVRALMS